MFEDNPDDPNIPYFLTKYWVNNLGIIPICKKTMPHYCAF